MTAAARMVLGDCKAALEMLEEEVDGQRWRVLWVGAMALLRAVGHVLKKVDGGNAAVRPFVDAAYDRWKTDRLANVIFWEFIEKSRNNILKEYRFEVLDSAEVGLVVLGRSYGRSASGEELFTVGENLYRPLTEGLGEGEDARDIYREAVSWWDAELACMEEGLRS